MTDPIQPPEAEDAARLERTRAERRAYYKKNSERINAERRRRYADDAEYRTKVLTDNRKTSREHRLRRAYGISLQDYDRMFARQGGRCAMCWKTSEHSLCVDHSHRTGILRGLLCINCNVGFGNFSESPAFLRRAADYGEFFAAHEEEILRGDPAVLQEAARLRERMLSVDMSSLLPPAGAAQPAKSEGKKKNVPGSPKQGSTKRRQQMRRQRFRPNDRAGDTAPTAPAGGRSPSRRQTQAPARRRRNK
jgi:hypothetical protein